MLRWVSACFLLREIIERKVNVWRPIKIGGPDTEQAPIIRARPDPKKVLNETQVRLVLD
jgi:hypothetical protein